MDSHWTKLRELKDEGVVDLQVALPLPTLTRKSRFAALGILDAAVFVAAMAFIYASQWWGWGFAALGASLPPVWAMLRIRGWPVARRLVDKAMQSEECFERLYSEGTISIVLTPRMQARMSLRMVSLEQLLQPPFTIRAPHPWRDHLDELALSPAGVEWRGKTAAKSRRDMKLEAKRSDDETSQHPI